MNRVINFDDFVLLTNHFGQNGTNWDKGNYNLDNVTNVADLVELTNRFGMTFTSAQPVPKASTLSLMAGVLLVVRKHGRRSQPSPGHVYGPVNMHSRPDF